MSIRERLDTLSRGELAALSVVVLVTLAGVGLWYVRSLPRAVEVSSLGGGHPSPVAKARSSSASAVPIVVHVAGLVRRPGVYTFAEGDRVIDAIKEAGGAKPNADLTALNLAATLADGTQILVPRLGSTSTTSSGVVTAPAGTSLINVNAASATELEELPGIGEVLAAAIVDYRTDNGPFATPDQLMDVSGIGPATLEEIRDLITV
jgi:competence protein ComEA